MLEALPAIFALLVAIAGWFYLFYSRAAANLSSVESQTINRLRVRLRRTGGLMMIVLAVAFYAACVALDRQNMRSAAAYLGIVLLLLVAILVFGLIDLNLTRKVRRSQGKQERLR